MTDAMWARTGDMLPGRKPDPGGTAADSRLLVEAVPVRFRRRVLSGVSGRVPSALSGDSGPERVSVDGTVVQAPRKAAAPEKGGPGSGNRAFQGRPDDQDRRRRGRARLPGPLQDPCRPGAWPSGGAGASGRAGVRGLRRRQGVRRRLAAGGSGRARGGGGGPAGTEPDGAAGA